ncbi:MAG: hypothetical protein RL662_1192 [Bacteroidota bacterium]|jgi:hypothetical protein
MKQFIFVSLLLILVGGCNNSDNKVLSAENQAMPDTTSIQLVLEYTDRKGVVHIGEDFYLSAIDSATESTYDFEKYKLKSFSRTQGERVFYTYYILKEFKLSDSFTTLLIAEYSENESAAWLVNYTDNYELIAAHEVFYENAEGFMSINTQLDTSNATLKVLNHNIYTDPENTISSFNILPSGKIEQQ